MPKENDQENRLAALEVRFDSDAGKQLTVREYLCKLLTTLWTNGECFSGKRPFGNSGWENDLLRPLISSEFIGGTLDEEGYVEDYNDQEVDDYMHSLITTMCQVGA